MGGTHLWVSGPETSVYYNEEVLSLLAEGAAELDPERRDELVVVLVIIAVIGPYMAPYPGDAEGGRHLERRFQPPSDEHPFGTDEMGRDMFSRVIIGA